MSLVRVGRSHHQDSGGESDEEVHDDVSHVNMTVEGYYSPSAATAQDLIEGFGNGWLPLVKFNCISCTELSSLSS